MKKTTLTILIFILFYTICSNIFAQNRYIVHFTDKNNTPYTIQNPEAFLSTRAIKRRSNQKISITENDLPPNPDYIQQVKNLGADVFYSSRWFNAILVEATNPIKTQIENLAFVKEVEFVAQGTKLLNAKITDKFSEEQSQQANFSLADMQREMLGADFMHASGFTGKGVTIAVFDAGFLGVNNNLPFFQHVYQNNQIKYTFDFTTNQPNVYKYHQHGTQVLSCIAAKNDDFAGTAYDADFVLCVTEDASSELRVEEYNWLFAAEWADSIGIDVISSSLGYSEFDDANMNYTYNDLDGKKTVISRAAQKATEVGIVVVTSAGNSGNKPWKYITAPADALDIIAVGAINADSVKASFSSFGPSADNRIKPDIVAMGVNTQVGNPNGTTGTANGTSFSCPLVAGLVAGFWQANPSLTSLEVKECIMKSAHLYETPNSEMGFGIPNYERAQAIADESILNVFTENDFNNTIQVYPNPTENRTLTLKTSPQWVGKEVTLDIFNAYGQSIKKEFIKIKQLNTTLSLPYTTANGIYFLQLSGENLKKSIKIFAH